MKKNCLICNEPIGKGKQKFCSNECYRLYYASKAEHLNPRFGRTSATTGAISELEVSIDLMRKGYDVFRALSPSCPCDLIAMKNSKFIRIEVRTARIGITGTLYTSRPSRDNPDKTDIYAWVSIKGITYEPELL